MNVWNSFGRIGTARIINAVASFLALIIFARILDSHEMGVFFLFLAILGVSVLFVDFGFSGAVEKRISEGSPPEDILATIALPKLVLYLLFISIVFASGSYINGYVGSNIQYSLIIGVIAKDIYTIFRRIINGQLRVAETAPLIASEQLGLLIFGSVGIYFVPTVDVAIYAYIVTLILLSFWSIYIARVNWGNATIANFRSLLSYAKFEMVSEAGWRVYNWTDVLVIGFFLSQSYVSGYEIAWRLAGVTVLLGHAARTSFFPLVSSWDSNGQDAKIQTTIEQMLAVSLVLVFPALVGTLVLSEQILSIVYGSEYAFAGVVFVILVGQKIVQGVDQVVGYSLRAMNRPRITAIATLIGASCNILLNIGLVSLFGITGAAISTLLSYGVMVLIKWYFIDKMIGVTLPNIISWFMIASVIMGIMIQFIDNMINVSNLTELTLVLTFSALVYGLLVGIHTDVRNEISQIINHDI
ncbi:flippase [Haladaptatus sp. T7]|uniref:flippase n=1 Tax=Haladaptatus sp. T7 TaxID=2029368 RepID=UPI0021A25A02|nr:flippase [Haladaptatus sp. T7]GKZ14547.1 hypothetical protein HAL_24280 [Haladaptatus sp. T7]